MEKCIIIVALMTFGFAIAIFEICYLFRQRKGSVQQRIVVRSFLALGVMLLLFVGLPLVLYTIGLIPRWLYWLMLGLFLVSTAFTNIWASKKLKKVQRVKKDNSS